METQERWEKWIPGLRLPRKIASLFCRERRIYDVQLHVGE